MSLQPLTLLVVEDFVPMWQTIKGFLRHMGYTHLLEAENGVQALTHLQQQPVALVLAHPGRGELS